MLNILITHNKRLPVAFLGVTFTCDVARSLPLYTLNCEVLCDSACVKYLGQFICSDLTDDTDILRQRRCLYIQGNVLLRKFHMRYIGVRLALVRSFCSPMYT